MATNSLSQQCWLPVLVALAVSRQHRGYMYSPVVCLLTPDNCPVLADLQRTPSVANQ